MNSEKAVDNPRVSVVMAVFNGAQFIKDSINSILCQSYESFEFIIIDDGSKDRGVELVKSFDDPRIRLLRNPGNLGLAASLNRGIKMARGEYVARMDCDDISLRTRLEKQVAFLDSHADVGVCGTWLRYTEDSDKRVHYPTEPEIAKAGFLFNPTVAHPTVMFRKELFAQHGLYYDESCLRAQDYELWSRALPFVKFSNVPEVLFLYRLHSSQASSAYNAQQLEAAGRVRHSLLLDLGVDPTKEEFEIHQRISNYLVKGDRAFFEKVDMWLCQLKEANDRNKVYSEPHFSAVLMERLVTLLKKMLEQKVLPKGLWLRPRLFQKTGLGWGYVLKHFMRVWRGKFVQPGN